MRRLSALLLVALLTALASAGAGAQTADRSRQAEVAQRGPEVMPFALAATQHIFTKTPTGGVQRVVVRRSDDSAQRQLVRSHLAEIRDQFSRGDFSGPARIHGDAMPGLAALRAAPVGAIAIQCREVQRGAELIYSTRDPALVQALHAWFDAQLSDHGTDATAGPATHGAGHMHRH